MKILLKNIAIIFHARKDTGHLPSAVFLHILMVYFRLGSVKLFLVVVHAFLHFDLF